MTDELDFTPRQPTARIPIFCQVCKRNGHVAYRREDDPRYGGGYFTGPTMRLGDYLAGKPKVCSTCERKGTNGNENHPDTDPGRRKRQR